MYLMLALRQFDIAIVKLIEIVKLSEDIGYLIFSPSLDLHQVWGYIFLIQLFHAADSDMIPYGQ